MQQSYNTDQIQIVDSFEAFINTPFQGKVNAIGWLREIDADFEEIAKKLVLKDDITEVSMGDLNTLNLSEKGNIARQIIIQDFIALEETGAQPSLNLLKAYPTDDEFDFITTDVYSFHVDRSPIPTSTILCTYFGASSDIIENDVVIQKIKIPEVREKLMEIYEDKSISFDEFLVENYFDMHYETLPNAKPINLGNVHLWRLAVDHPLLEVLPCVHRAPKENINEARLLLIC